MLHFANRVAAILTTIKGGYGIVADLGELERK